MADPPSKIPQCKPQVSPKQPQAPLTVKMCTGKIFSAKPARKIPPAIQKTVHSNLPQGRLPPMKKIHQLIPKELVQVSHSSPPSLTPNKEDLLLNRQQGLTTPAMKDMANLLNSKSIQFCWLQEAISSRTITTRFPSSIIAPWQ